MKQHATLANGDTYLIDTGERTITRDGPPAARPADLIGAHAEHLLATGTLIGPQVDENVGVTGDWADPRAPVVALVEAAQAARTSVVSVETVEP